MTLKAGIHAEYNLALVEVFSGLRSTLYIGSIFMILHNSALTYQLNLETSSVPGIVVGVIMTSLIVLSDNDNGILHPIKFCSSFSPGPYKLAKFQSTSV